MSAHPFYTRSPLKDFSTLHLQELLKQCTNPNSAPEGFTQKEISQELASRHWIVDPKAVANVCA